MELCVRGRNEVVERPQVTCIVASNGLPQICRVLNHLGPKRDEQSLSQDPLELDLGCA